LTIPISLPKYLDQSILSHKPLNFLKLNLNISSNDYYNRLLELEKENILDINSRELMIKDLNYQECFISGINYMSKSINIISIIKLLNEFRNTRYLSLKNTKVVFEIINIEQFHALNIKRLSIENKKLYYIEVSGMLNLNILIE